MRSELVGVLGVVPESAAEKNAAEIELAAEIAPAFVEGSADALPAAVGMRADVGAVQRVGLGIVIREVPAVGDARPRVMA